MYDGSSGFRLWANANKVKKESISIIDEGKVGINSLSQDEDWAMAAKVAAAGDWANAETTAEWELILLLVLSLGMLNFWFVTKTWIWFLDGL